MGSNCSGRHPVRQCSAVWTAAAAYLFGVVMVPLVVANVWKSAKGAQHTAHVLIWCLNCGHMDSERQAVLDC